MKKKSTIGWSMVGALALILLAGVILYLCMNGARIIVLLLSEQYRKFLLIIIGAILLIIILLLVLSSRMKSKIRVNNTTIDVAAARMQNMQGQSSANSMDSNSMDLF